MKNKKLKLAIANSGYKQKWIAEKIGIHYSLLSRFVCGDREPCKQYKRDICKILKVKESDIFC